MASKDDSGKPDVNQTNNSAGGDIVAGDKKVSQIFLSATSNGGQLACLLEKLKAEELTGIHAKQFIDELKRFCEPVEPHPIGLEAKLKNGHREDLVVFALEAKEQFYKKLAQNTFFESAQEIHALLLSKIYSSFCTEISPQIKLGRDRTEIDLLIRERIINPVAQELQTTPFRYYDEHVYGMLYYLTGNCYVKWT